MPWLETGGEDGVPDDLFVGEGRRVLGRPCGGYVDEDLLRVPVVERREI
jgi:hypothetical protein